MAETETTSKNTITNKKLSIQVSLNGLSFCILDKEESKIIYFKKLDFQKQLDPIRVLSQIELLYEKEEALNQAVDEVVLLYTNPLFSLVPQDLFDEEQASNYLKFNTKILKTDFIAHDVINENIVNVYIPYTNITNYFFDRYGEFEYKHSLSVLIDSLLALEKTKDIKVYLHSHLSSYELVILENGELIFANHFEYESKEDFLYYLLFTAEQLHLDPEKFELVLLGDITKDSEEYKIIWEYIRNISWMGPFHPFSFEAYSQPENQQAEYLLLKSL